MAPDIPNINQHLSCACKPPHGMPKIEQMERGTTWAIHIHIQSLPDERSMRRGKNPIRNFKQETQDS